MRKIISLAAAVIGLSFLVLPVSSALAAGGPTLVCNVQPNSNDNFGPECDTNYPSSTYGIAMYVQGGSGTYSYAWGVPSGVTITGGCTSTSNLCDFSVRGSREHYWTVPLVITQGGTQTSLSALVFTPASCGNQLC
jgi:hypothetical protein